MDIMSLPSYLTSGLPPFGLQYLSDSGLLQDLHLVSRYLSVQYLSILSVTFLGLQTFTSLQLPDIVFQDDGLLQYLSGLFVPSRWTSSVPYIWSSRTFTLGATFAGSST